MKNILELIKGSIGKKHISNGRNSIDDFYPIDYDMLLTLDQITRVHRVLNSLDTNAVLVKEPNDLLNMSTEEFDKYFASQLQKLLDIWVRRVKREPFKDYEKPSLIRAFKKGGEKSNEKSNE